MCWDPVKPLHLYLLTNDWSTYTYVWSWSTDRSQGYNSHDNANVAVIDGGERLQAFLLLVHKWCSEMLF